MSVNGKIKADIQKLDIGSDLISLYCVDASSFGGGVYYFVPGTENGEPVRFNGITYEPLPVKFSGFKVSSDGRPPRPQMAVSNVRQTFSSFVNAYDDGVGATVTRTRTFRKYIDGHAEADAAARFPVDVYEIEQKLSQSKYEIVWELVSPFDHGDRFIPKGQVIGYCQSYYRASVNGTYFDYTNATCPYTGGGYFDENGVPTTLSGDACGKRLSDCMLRYPLPSDQLPFDGFPGAGQISKYYR